MASGPETLLVRRILNEIRAKYKDDAMVIKVHGNPYQTGGLPDILVCLRGHLIGIEVKAPRSGESRERTLSRVTLRQQAVMDRMALAGATVGVALSVEEAMDIVDNAPSVEVV